MPIRSTTPVSWDPWCEAHETHSGAVVLLGDLAYKVKKPVDLEFLDFTDLATRRRVCQREVELNRRMAPDVYLGVGSLAGPAADPEPVIVMRRMPDELRLARLVRSGRPITDEIRSIARHVAAFHSRARTGPEVVRQGTRDALRARWDANLEQAATTIDATSYDEIRMLVHRFLDGRQALFDDRIRRGAIVDGHGDLTPDDVFCLPDGPRLLDCLEFDDTLRYVDRLDDIAFLAMGLGELGAPEAARTLIETWAECVGDPAPPSLVHHFIAYRAFVRAKVSCLSGAERTGGGTSRYVETTLAHLRAGAVKLVLVGGPPASGKSTLSGAIADRLGMTVLSSDRLRKELAGVDPLNHTANGFEGGIYRPAHTEATYQALLGRARSLLGRGESVVLDATWTSAKARRAASALALETSVDLMEIRCEVDEAIADERIRTRASISDADQAVAAELRRITEPWPTSRPVNTGLALSQSVDQAIELIRPGPTPRDVVLRRPRLAAD
jgi:aminoglycoside phosphotransferase family enzyme/predicted kinase